MVGWLLRTWQIKHFRSTLAVALFVVIFLLPVADELAARPQFNSLCERGAVLKIDADRIKGKTVRLKLETLNAPVGGTPVPIDRSRLVFLDNATNEELGSYQIYSIRGGFLRWLTGWPESDEPWTIDKKTCAPELRDKAVARTYEFTLVD